MNKGLELIEAVHLFGVSANMVEIVLHPQSIIHSMVEYIDNAVLAQMSVPDMRLCIQYALTAPDRLHAPTTPLDFFTCGALTFDRPDYDVFPLPLLARHAIERGEIVRRYSMEQMKRLCRLFYKEKSHLLHCRKSSQKYVKIFQ